MTPKLIKIRDENENNYYASDEWKRWDIGESFISPYQAGANFMYEQLAPLIEALKFYADGNSWSTIDFNKHPITYDRLEYDKDLGSGSFQINSETDDSNVSGKRAREALKKIEGE